MPTKSGKEKRMYDMFKKEAELKTLVSSETGVKKKVIKFRGVTYPTGSYYSLFDSIKDKLYEESY
jgi:hypothetical protein